MIIEEMEEKAGCDFCSEVRRIYYVSHSGGEHYICKLCLNELQKDDKRRMHK